MELNKNTFIIFGIIIICCVIIKYVVNSEHYTDKDKNKKLFNQILDNTENLLESKKLYDDPALSEDTLNRLINNELQTRITSNVISPDLFNTLNNETLKTLQYIELNELKLILDKINRVENLKIISLNKK
jgi:hypothetical protein